MEFINGTIVAVNLAAMLIFGWWGKSRTRNSSDFLVSGRRLGPLLYTGTMAAVVLAATSTGGGVGSGQEFGISGVWLAVAIGAGVILLSLLFAPTLQRLKIFTDSQMLTLRYGSKSAANTSGTVMLAYTIMLCATIFVVLLGWEPWKAVAIGGIIVVIYSTLGGMWSITLADQVQSTIKTLGIFVLMLPLALNPAGGLDGIRECTGDELFSLTGIGVQTIITHFVVCTLGLLIGQDIWQRVFTAKSAKVARWGGTTAGIHCVRYGAAGAIIGMAAKVALPDIVGTDANKDVVYAEVATQLLPVAVVGLVLAAAVAAMMSTASGALIAAATVARADVTPFVASWFGKRVHVSTNENPEHDMRANRIWVLLQGVVAIELAIAYDILVGGLLEAVIGGLIWKGGKGLGSAASLAAGTIVTPGNMITLEIQAENRFHGVYANEPIYFGLIASALEYILVSLLTQAPDPAVTAPWDARVAGQADAEGADLIEIAGR